MVPRPRTNVPLGTVHREVNVLVEADVLDEKYVGRTRLVRVNPDHPAAEPLVRLVEVVYGPATIIREQFSKVPGAERVLIFGSWVRRAIRARRDTSPTTSTCWWWAMSDGLRCTPPPTGARIVWGST